MPAGTRTGRQCSACQPIPTHCNHRFEPDPWGAAVTVGLYFRKQTPWQHLTTDTKNASANSLKNKKKTRSGEPKHNAGRTIRRRETLRASRMQRPPQHPVKARTTDTLRPARKRLFLAPGQSLAHKPRNRWFQRLQGFLFWRVSAAIFSARATHWPA